MKLSRKYIWDYDIKENWQPKNLSQWLWYLERKINYDDWKGLNKKIVKKYFRKLRGRLDPGKIKMLEYYFKKY